MATKTHLHIILNSDEYELVSRRANKHGLSLADYIRFAIVHEALMAGDLKMWKVFSKGLSQKLIYMLKGAAREKRLDLTRPET